MELGDGRALYEHKADDEHHDHIICLETGKIIEFYNEKLEQLQDQIVKEHGYKLVRHVHQLFVKPIKKKLLHILLSFNVFNHFKPFFFFQFLKTY